MTYRQLQEAMKKVAELEANLTAAKSFRERCSYPVQYRGMLQNRIDNWIKNLEAELDSEID